MYNEMLREWLKQPNYVKMTVFPLQDILRRLGNIIRIKYAIPQHTNEKWMQKATEETKPAPFYCAPKIHEAKLGSRPISAQHSYILAHLSKQLADILLPVQKSLFGIKRDTKRAVEIIEPLKITDPFVFLTYDVKECYPSIPFTDAIQTLYDYIPIMRGYNGFWTKIIQFVINKNYVTDHKNTYRQMIWTAAGTQVSPAFANLNLYYKFQCTLQHK